MVEVSLFDKGKYIQSRISTYLIAGVAALETFISCMQTILYAHDEGQWGESVTYLLKISLSLSQAGLSTIPLCPSAKSYI